MSERNKTAFNESGWKQILSFSGIMNMTYGFFDGSGVSKNATIDECKAIINSKIVENG